MTDNEIIIGLATIVVLGVGAQWIARRRSFPSLLLLLPFGLLAGSVLDLEPEQLFGDTLFPGVTLLVGLLLFQSGLGLRFGELPKHARRPVLHLVTVGAAVTFLGGSLAVWGILEPRRGLAFVVGAVLVVSGPTVVGPLLSVVRPRDPTDAILRWEGTVLDPIGATLAVVIVNLVLAAERDGLHPALQMLVRLGTGAGIGVVAAILLVFVMSRFLVTDNMEAAVALLFAVAAFTAAELVASEAGLFATVTLGIVAANQRIVPTSRISGFGENLEVLIIGSLFIVLGALVDLRDLIDVAWRVGLLVLVLVLVVRPLAVSLSMLGTALPARDRALIGWVDPRGVVAASVAASFAATLSASGFETSFMLPTVFGVILGTGVIYGLTASPAARLLGVRRPAPTGVAVVGDAAWLGELAARLTGLGVDVLVVTSTPAPASARASGADTPPGELRAAEPPATGAGRLSTASLVGDERGLRVAVEEARIAKALVYVHAGLTEDLVTADLAETLGRRNVYRVFHDEETTIERSVEFASTERAVGPGVTDAEVRHHVERGARVDVIDTADVEQGLLLAAVRPDGTVNLHPGKLHPAPSDVLVGLVDA